MGYGTKVVDQSGNVLRTIVPPAKLSSTAVQKMIKSVPRISDKVVTN